MYGIYFISYDIAHADIAHDIIVFDYDIIVFDYDITGNIPKVS